MIVSGEWNLEVVWRLAGDDTIDGGGGEDWIQANDGDDLIATGEGADTVMGGEGDDTVSYAASDAPVDVDLMRMVDACNSIQYGGHADEDRLTGVESVIGSKFGDIIAADHGENRLGGGGGDDTLTGGDGADVLRGGAGNDVLEGGAGDDVFVIRPGQGVDLIRDLGPGDLVDLSDFGIGYEDLSFTLHEEGMAAILPGDEVIVFDSAWTELAAEDFIF